MTPRSHLPFHCAACAALTFSLIAWPTGDVLPAACGAVAVVVLRAALWFVLRV